MGGGFQNAGAYAPPGVGHQWLVASAADVAGVHTSVDGIIWVPGSKGMSSVDRTAVGCVEGSRVVANRLYAWTPISGGVSGGRLLRGTYNPTTKVVSWVDVSTTAKGALAGGSVHPRQTGRTLALDEANGYAYGATIDGIYQMDLSTGANSRRVLAGVTITGIVLDPDDTQIAYATADADGTAGTAGFYRITNLRSGTATATQYATIGAPQDVALATVAGTKYCWVAADTNGIWRWLVSTDPTTGWTDVSGSLVLTPNGYCGVDVAPGASLATTKLLATTAGAGTPQDGGAYSADGGATWSRESTGWTVSEAVAGPPKTDAGLGTTTDWWVTESQITFSLSGNTFDAVAPRFNPSNSAEMMIFGRSGVWRSINSAVNWNPTAQGLCVTVARVVACDPSNTARVAFGDTDWTILRSTDRFVGMPDKERPVNTNVRGLMFRDDGTLAAAFGDRDFNTGGECYVSANPYAATPTWTSQGFGAAGGAARCHGVAIGQDGSANQVVLTLVEGLGIYRKVGAGAPVLASATPQPTFTGDSEVHFCWPQGHTGRQYVYCSAANGLFRSTDWGATWTTLWTFTQVGDYPGSIAFDPVDPNIIYLTVDDNASNIGLYKLANAHTGSPTPTLIGPTITEAGPCATHPTSGLVYVATTAANSAGAKLYRSTARNPGAGDSFADITDEGWAGGVTFPRAMAVAADSTVYAANQRGGYLVKNVSGLGN